MRACWQACSLTLGTAVQLHCGSLAKLEATWHILVACDGVAEFVSDFVRDMAIDSEPLLPPARGQAPVTLHLCPQYQACQLHGCVPGSWRPSNRHDPVHTCKERRWCTVGASVT